MPDAPPCPRCGAPIPADAGGVCPACALAAAAGSAPRSRFRAPPIAELAPLFPELELIEPIGAGAMGAVFRARQRKLERVVALKVLPADGQIGERFPREAAALARLNHPNLVAVYDVGRTDGWCWLVMELIDGANLRQVMATGRMAQRDALALMLPLCDALAYAHAQGVVHRDIKPENILLDARGRPKLADFGLAKLAGSPVVATGTGQALGTPHYMAPEQVEGGRDVDGRADLYALGVVLYELLTGGLPLGRFAAPSQASGVDARLDAIVLRLLEKDPAKRYPDAHALARDLAAVDSGLAVAPAPQGERARRDALLLILYAIALASVLLSGGRFEFLLSALLGGGRAAVVVPMALVGLALVLAIAWGGRVAARGGGASVSVARFAAACAVPIFLVWQPLAGIAALVVVWHLFDDGLWPLAELRATLRRAGRVHELHASVGRTARPHEPRGGAPPAPVVVHARAEAAPPASQHIVVQTKADRAHIGFFGFLATIVRGVFHLVGIALLLAAAAAAWALLDPTLAQRARRAAESAGIPLPPLGGASRSARSRPALAADLRPGMASLHRAVLEPPDDDPIARIAAAMAYAEALLPHQYQRDGDAAAWAELRSDAGLVASVRRRAEGDAPEAAAAEQPPPSEVAAMARRAVSRIGAVATGWPVPIATGSGGSATASIDPGLELALDALGDAWSTLAERPTIALAMGGARFAAVRQAVEAAPEAERAASIAEAASRFRFTAVQANALLDLLPVTDRARAVTALRPHVVDIDDFAVSNPTGADRPSAGGSVFPPAEAAP